MVQLLSFASSREGHCGKAAGGGGGDVAMLFALLFEVAVRGDDLATSTHNRVLNGFRHEVH